MGNIDNTDLNELLKEATRDVDDAIESRSVLYNTPSGRLSLIHFSDPTRLGMLSKAV